MQKLVTAYTTVQHRERQWDTQAIIADTGNECATVFYHYFTLG